MGVYPLIFSNTKRHIYRGGSPINIFENKKDIYGMVQIVFTGVNSNKIDTLSA